MPELHLERIYKLRNYPSVDIRVVISSTEGAVLGRAQTGGVMQVIMQAPKAIMITAGVHVPFGAAKQEMPGFVSSVIKNAAESFGRPVNFVSRFSVSSMIEGRSITQEEAMRLFDRISQMLEQQVEHVEIGGLMAVREASLRFQEQPHPAVWRY